MRTAVAQSFQKQCLQSLIKDWYFYCSQREGVRASFGDCWVAIYFLACSWGFVVLLFENGRGYRQRVSVICHVWFYLLKWAKYIYLAGTCLVIYMAWDFLKLPFKSDGSWMLFTFTRKAVLFWRNYWSYRPSVVLFSCLFYKIKGTEEIGRFIVMLVRCLLWIAELHTCSNVFRVDPWYVFQIIILRILLVRKTSLAVMGGLVIWMKI